MELLAGAEEMGTPEGWPPKWVKTMDCRSRERIGSIVLPDCDDRHGGLTVGAPGTEIVEVRL